ARCPEGHHRNGAQAGANHLSHADSARVVRRERVHPARNSLPSTRGTPAQGTGSGAWFRPLTYKRHRNSKPGSLGALPASASPDGIHSAVTCARRSSSFQRTATAPLTLCLILGVQFMSVTTPHPRP